MTAIQVSDEMAGTLRVFCEGTGMSMDEVIRQGLQCLIGKALVSGSKKAVTPVGGGDESGGLRTQEGALLPNGLKLRKRYKGKVYEGEVKGDVIRLDGFEKQFNSPSVAGIAVTGYNVNGWRFWEYLADADANRWRPLEELRHNSR